MSNVYSSQSIIHCRDLQDNRKTVWKRGLGRDLLSNGVKDNSPLRSSFSAHPRGPDDSGGGEPDL